jgi:uncharacterized membrane protein
MDWSQCLAKNPDGTPVEGGVATISCIPIILSNLINAALIFSGIVAVIFIIIGGFKYIRSGGDPKQVDGARKTLTFAIIGLILVLLSFFILFMISSFTGVDCIRTFGFTNCVGN